MKNKSKSKSKRITDSNFDNYLYSLYETNIDSSAVKNTKLFKKLQKTEQLEKKRSISNFKRKFEKKLNSRGKKRDSRKGKSNQ